MATNSATEVHKELANVAEGSRDRQLIFNPRTGQFEVATRTERPASPDAVVATDIAGEGFFTRLV